MAIGGTRAQPHRYAPTTFTERFRRYPVRVECLSRFRTHREQRAVLRDLQAGAVDIVVGAHRLLSADVAFRALRGRRLRAHPQVHAGAGG